MLRGNAPAKIDDKGRLKIPNAFRVAIQQDHGREVFVTSLTGESVLVYPMPVWIEVERKLAQVPSTHPARLKFLDRVNFFGQVAEIDPQGRVLIHPRLRESALMTGEVDVMPLDDEAAMQAADPQANGWRFDGPENDAREAAMAERLTKAGPVAVCILGKNHDIADDVKAVCESCRVEVVKASRMDAMNSVRE